MKSSTRVVAIGVTVLMLTLTAIAQRHDPPAPTDATVDFGVFVSAAIPGTGCATSGFGGPTDPCSYKLHHLTPEEVTIAKGGQVTFQVHGGGHGFALYEV